MSLIARDPDAGRSERAARISELFDEIDSWQERASDFVESLREQFEERRTLSDRQIAALEDINERRRS